MKTKTKMKANKSAANRTARRNVKVYGRYIVADPAICHGAMTFRGTRIFVNDVLEQVARGLSFDAIVEMWGGRVPKAAIAEALRLAHEALRKSGVEPVTVSTME
jgi:uncharacterized protein (DUF433 family)